VRWRLSAGLGSTPAARCVSALTRFARFLAAPPARVDRLADIDRAVLERYLADLHAEFAGRPVHRSDIGLLNAFFQAIRQHSWDPTLPATATFYPEDYPTAGEQLPRAVAEHVMAQVEHAANLDRWDNPAYQLVTLVLIRCGLRVSDALKLPFDWSPSTPTAPPTCATTTTR
jgi:site-specific recombinase XerD